MEVTVTLCDKEGCKKKNTTFHESWAYTEGDPSGNGSCSWNYRFDLCPEHSKEWARRSGNELEGPKAGELLRKLKINYRIR